MKRSVLSKHIIHGLKTGLACVLSYGATEYLNMPYGFWAVISTVIVMQVYVADSISMCVYRFTGTAIGAVLGVIAIIAFPDTPIWVGVSLFITTSICSFMTRYHRRYKMAAITVAIVILASLTSPDRVNFAIFRIFEIGIGILCAFLVSVLVAPAKRVDELKEDLGAQATECSEKYNQIIDAFLSGQQHVEENLLENLTRQIWTNQESYQMIKRNEGFIYKKKVSENLTRLVSTMARCVEHLRTMTRALNAIEGTGFKIIMEHELENLTRITGETLILLVRDESETDTTSLEVAMDKAEQRLKVLRAAGATTRFDIEKLTQFFSFYHSVRCLAEEIMYANGKMTS